MLSPMQLICLPQHFLEFLGKLFEPKANSFFSGGFQSS